MYKGLLAFLAFAYLDIHVNLIAMDVRSTIEYACFATLVCQGTTGMAEIHRQLMKNREYYQSIYYGTGASFFDYLKDRWDEFMPDKALGACSSNRFNYPNCTTDWSRLSKKIYKLFMKFHRDSRTTSRKVLMNEMVSKISSILMFGKNENNHMIFPGSGKFTTVLFLQLSSLLGLIPLYCSSFAEIVEPKYGPGSLIRNAMNDPKKSAVECNKELVEVQKKFYKIWGGLLTLALLENMFCELYRSFGASVENYLKQNPQTKASPGLEILFDEQYCVESNAKDIFFFDEARGCMQNLFLVRSTGPGESELRPMLLMKHSALVRDGVVGDKSVIRMTNWCQNKDDPMNVCWDAAPRDMKLSTTLKTSSYLTSVMTLDKN